MGDTLDSQGGNANGGDPILLDESISSGSSQDGEHDHDVDDHDDDGPLDEMPAPPPQPQKRKGGRKPIYATSEERKQRNRQAQAAFRERRTEYIKQLEATIKRHEENLIGLQQSQRNALDECLMLRYKNSLLERILVEKGIDVQAELQAKNHSSPNFGPTRVPASAPSGPQGISRFSAGGKYGRRPLSISAKPDSSDGVLHNNRSPLSQPNSASHLPSPIAPLARSPNFLPQAGVGGISPSFGPQSGGPQQQPLRAATQPLRPTQFPGQGARGGAAFGNPLSAAHSPASAASLPSAAPANAQYAFVPAFQNHYDQLDQEYENMLDEQDPDTAFPSASYSAPSMQSQGGALPPAGNPNGLQQHSMAPPPQQQQQQQQNVATEAQQGVLGGQGGFEGYDPILDADPFGLSATMGIGRHGLMPGYGR